MRRQNDNVGKAISVPGLLALMCGAGMLYSYVVYRWGRSTTPLWKAIVVGGSVLLVVWGLVEIIRSLYSDYRGRRRRRARAEESHRPPSRTMRFVFGLLLLTGGLSLSVVIALRAEASLTVVLAITIGSLLFVAGLRNIVAALQPARTVPYAFLRLRLPLPGAAFLMMMSAFFVGSLIGRSNMLMLVFAFMAGPFVINGWVTLRMLAQTRVSRKLPHHVMAGEPLDVELTIENGKSVMSSWLLDVTDRIAGNREELQTGVLFTRVPPASTRSECYQLRLMQRGRYYFGPLVVSSRFPLGFVERALEFTADGDVIVFPRLGKLTEAWKQDSLTALELVEKEDPRPGIYDDEFHRLREFRWGDNPRAIHWRTAARRNELMVREYHQSRERDLVVLLDLWVPEKPTDDDRQRVELAVSFAATVCIEHMRDSREAIVTLSAAGKSAQRWRGQAGAAAFDSLLEVLALLQPGPSLNAGELQDRAGLSTAGGVRTLLITTHEHRLRMHHGPGSLRRDASVPDRGPGSLRRDASVPDRGPGSLGRDASVPDRGPGSLGRDASVPDRGRATRMQDVADAHGPVATAARVGETFTATERSLSRYFVL